MLLVNERYLWRIECQDSDAELEWGGSSPHGEISRDPPGQPPTPADTHENCYHSRANHLAPMLRRGSLVEE